MQKFVKKDDLIDYLIKENLPNEIYYEATFYMETVQECNDGGAGAMLVISPRVGSKLASILIRCTNFTHFQTIEKSVV